MQTPLFEIWVYFCVLFGFLWNYIYLHRGEKSRGEKMTSLVICFALICSQMAPSSAYVENYFLHLAKTTEAD